MTRQFAALFFALFVLFVGTVQGAIVGQEVEYPGDGATLKGYLAYDDSIQGKRPGVLVVHEWWGLNDYVRQRARMLAELGYTALAVDMYGGKVASHPDDAGKFASEVGKNFPLAKARFSAAHELLSQHATVDKSRIAAIGYCFGGAMVLNMARSGMDLDGVVSFHGNLTPAITAEPGSVKAQILVLHGADDPFVTQEQIAAFKTEMDKAGATYSFIAYPGAVHGFTNPGADELGKKFNMPLAYNAAADKASWHEMQQFFKKIFMSKS